jgi:RNA polymerase sigma factor (TIGR02999 family)
MGDITKLLEEARAGKDGAQETLYSRIYAELHKLARAKLAGGPILTLLDAPALVHEAYLRLTKQRTLPPGDRRLFFGYAATIMRSIIVDWVREKRAAKRGFGDVRVTLSTSNLVGQARDPDVEALDDALHDLQHIDERCRKVVEMRYFAGMSVDEVAQTLELSTATVERDWQKARAFLFKALQN